MTTGTISAVIPSAGHAASLESCLQSLSRQTVATGIEVLVVLDGDAAGRSAEIRGLRDRCDWPWPLRWIDQDVRRGPGAARNRGAREASGRYLIFLDDDMIASPELVATHLALLDGNPDTAIVGAIETRCIGYRGVYRHFIRSFWQQRHEQLTRHPATNFAECFSGNLAMAAELFRRAGGFDEALPGSEDLELGLKLERAGARLLYGAGALAVQNFRKSPYQTMRDDENRGVANVRLWRKYPEARRAITFAVSANGRQNARWLRGWALDSRLRWESLAFLLPWLPSTNRTEFLAWFLNDLAMLRGARREFADEQQWAAVSEGTILLCYHKFSRAGGERSKYVISIDRFDRQMEALKSNGFRFVTIQQWIAAFKRGEPIPGRTAIITVDDGTDDVVEHAVPILRSKGIPAVLFVVRDWIGRPGFLRSEQIKALAARGWEIGSHSLSHPRLPELSENRQREEIAASRSELALVTGSLPETFAYPYGECDASSQHLAAEAGYAAALGVAKGYAYLHTSRWDLPRFVVDGRWPTWLFRLFTMLGFSVGGLP